MELILPNLDVCYKPTRCWGYKAEEDRAAKNLLPIVIRQAPAELP